MNYSRQILKILFILLTLAVIVEVLIFLNVINPQEIIKNLSPNKQSNNQVISPTNQPKSATATPELTGPELINFLKTKTSKPTLISSQLVEKYQGKLTEIKPESGVSKNNNFKYDLLIRIINEKNETRTFAYNRDDINKMLIYKMNNDKKEKITLDDLKVGDQVTIEETQDLKITECSKDECFVRFEIIKL